MMFEKIPPRFIRADMYRYYSGALPFSRKCGNTVTINIVTHTKYIASIQHFRRRKTRQVTENIMNSRKDGARDLRALYEELAQELGTKPNTLASRVSRIKAKFRKNFPDSEHFLQDGCKESRPPGHKEGRGGSEP